MSWDRFKHYYLYIDTLNFGIDISRVDFEDAFLDRMEPKIQAAYTAMQALEAGSIANIDENRKVGHYWLRAAEMAPDKELTKAIKSCIDKIKQVASSVHSGTLKGAHGNFKNLLVIGIGGSALGPQFVADALGDPKTDRARLFFFDNTDPDGFDRTLSRLDGQLGETLSVVISKSGGTPETRNGMIEAEAAYRAAGLNFAEHAIAITGDDSKLDNYAKENNWLDTFPMWDWVGGRTSLFAAVGLLPAAIQGIDIDRMLAGAATMDTVTRTTETLKNPAALLALMWYHATDGKGAKDMVVLPYKDRLMLFSKYLQQLVMESLGKATDLDGKPVSQGITVYGNKGSTDQHAYVQQLREGVHNFFVTFIEVLKDRDADSIAVEKAFTSGDFLQGLLLGTRDALYEKGRQSITLTIEAVTPETVGQLIALFERAVGLYASLVNINAYHQPGVEAGKKAAATVLEIEEQVIHHIKANKGSPKTAESIAIELGLEPHKEIIFKLLFRLAFNRRQIDMNIKAPVSSTEFFST
ncbi:MAG: glucose-6-phosphate isomerase [Lentimonas sp.]|jgi:glucose-6-phosphate isomerase